MARVVVIGGHGKVALELARILTERGDEVDSVFRNPDHSDDVAATGARPVVADIERLDTDALADLVRGTRRRRLLRRGRRRRPGAHLRRRPRCRDPGDRRRRAGGVRRFVMVSYFGAGPDHGVPQDDPFFAYAEAKAAADAYLRASELAWTVLGPGPAHPGPPTGKIGLAQGNGEVSRADVALVVAAALADDSTIRRTIEFNNGDIPIAAALAG